MLFQSLKTDECGGLKTSYILVFKPYPIHDAYPWAQTRMT